MRCCLHWELKPMHWAVRGKRSKGGGRAGSFSAKRASRAAKARAPRSRNRRATWEAPGTTPLALIPQAPRVGRGSHDAVQGGRAGLRRRLQSRAEDIVRGVGVRMARKEASEMM